jgi:hypothetical protein
MNRPCSTWACLVLAMANLALADDRPAPTTGWSDLKFELSAPESAEPELLRRLGAAESPSEYDITRETFRCLVPTGDTPDMAWGLFVWVDASEAPRIPEDWERVLAAHKLLAVGAYRSGNQRDILDRYRLAVDAVHNMKQRFRVDPRRVYVSGVSGGGRVASVLGVAYGDVFTGAFPIVGVNFYKPVLADQPGKLYPPTYQPAAGVLAAAKKRNRFVLLTGETDLNRQNTRRVYKKGFKAEGFRHVLYLEVPSMGHACPPADWFAKGLDFLE